MQYNFRLQMAQSRIDEILSGSIERDVMFEVINDATGAGESIGGEELELLLQEYLKVGWNKLFIFIPN